MVIFPPYATVSPQERRRPTSLLILARLNSPRCMIFDLPAWKTFPNLHICDCPGPRGTAQGTRTCPVSWSRSGQGCHLHMTLGGGLSQEMGATTSGKLGKNPNWPYPHLSERVAIIRVKKDGREMISNHGGKFFIAPAVAVIETLDYLRRVAYFVNGFWRHHE